MVKTKIFSAFFILVVLAISAAAPFSQQTANTAEVPQVMISNQSANSGSGSQVVIENSFKPLITRNIPQSAGGNIQFSLGSTSAVISGYVNANQLVSYNLAAMINQEFIVTLDSDTKAAVLGITDDRGKVYLDPSSRQTFINTYLPQTGTYYVNVYNAGNNPTNYTFQVIIPARVTIPVGKTQVAYNGAAGSYSIVSYTAYAYKGQYMRADLYTGPSPKAWLRVSGLSTGIIYLDNNSYSPSWYAYLPETQDYLIEVVTLEEPVPNYRITFNIN